MPYWFGVQSEKPSGTQSGRILVNGVNWPPLTVTIVMRFSGTPPYPLKVIESV